MKIKITKPTGEFIIFIPSPESQLLIHDFIEHQKPQTDPEGLIITLHTYPPQEN